MRIVIYVTTLFLSVTLTYGQIFDNKIKIDTIINESSKCENCPILKDTVIYTLLKCGLYSGDNGDLAYQSSTLYGENFGRRTRYLTWVWGADSSDSINGGLKEMKYVINTVSFQFLNNMYWADKNNIYGITATSDGGSISLKVEADRNTFIVFGESEYAKDKNNVYYHNLILQGADSKTFETIDNNEISGLAFDKKHIYRFGKPLTETEILEFNLTKYKRKTNR
jgi:hypothetical protein